MKLRYLFWAILLIAWYQTCKDEKQGRGVNLYGPTSEYKDTTVSLPLADTVKPKQYKKIPEYKGNWVDIQ